MTTSSTPIHFRAETRQLLDILIHSLYTEREIFLRELISNASDALTRLDFEMLTKREVLDPDVPLSIRIIPDKEKNMLTITDTGVGMTAEELVENLGTIAHSGARAFVEAAQSGSQHLSDIIGQFGVGFYSAFMVAENIQVVSRSYRPEASAARWFSTGPGGDDTFTVEPAERTNRGTSVILQLKPDATEFLDESRLHEIVRKHSDFIPYPIFLGAESEEQVNRQTALWRQNPREVQQKDYDEFYKILTLDFDPPLATAHMVVDAPAQMYAILYVPVHQERGLFSLRKQDGLKLYARKVLIQEYCNDLLPEYFRFVQGVVDSEDLPLNVSREAVQANKVMAHLKRLVTSKIIDTLKQLAKDKPEDYAKFWKEFGRYIKEGIAIEQVEPESLYPLLRFHTTQYTDEWVSLEEYESRMKEGQPDIYFIMGDDVHSVLYSPHLDAVKTLNYDVLVMTDPVDAFMLVRLNKYKDHPVVNIASPDLDLPKSQKSPEIETAPSPSDVDTASLVERFKTQLGDRVADVSITDRLTDSPARLVDPQGAIGQELQRVYKLLKEDFEVPKKVLEINPHHVLLGRLSVLPADDPLSTLVIEQIYEDALLVEGLHPDPVGMILRLQKLMEIALSK
jgi:HSP90 family molecular chaperone